jgi:hypothetical protein
MVRPLANYWGTVAPSPPPPGYYGPGFTICKLLCKWAPWFRKSLTLYSA